MLLDPILSRFVPGGIIDQQGFVLRDEGTGRRMSCGYPSHLGGDVYECEKMSNFSDNKFTVHAMLRLFLPSENFTLSEIQFNVVKQLTFKVMYTRCKSENRQSPNNISPDF